MHPRRSGEVAMRRRTVHNLGREAEVDEPGEGEGDWINRNRGRI